MTSWFFTRCFSSASVGYFTSGRGAVGKKFKKKDLLAEFQRHRHLNNTELTALVSVSSRIVNTLSRELAKNRWIDRDGNRSNENQQTRSGLLLLPCQIQTVASIIMLEL